MFKKHRHQFKSLPSLPEHKTVVLECQDRRCSTIATVNKAQLKAAMAVENVLAA